MSYTPNKDPRIIQAENEVSSAYGDTVSVANKQKSLSKFGYHATVGTTFYTVAEFQGTVGNETFVSTNIIDSIVSSSASDTTQTITIEGHTVDGSGNLTFVSQTKALTGQTEATLTTPLCRCSRMYVTNTGTEHSYPTALVGQVVVYDNTDGITSGVPNTDAAVKCLIAAGETQSRKCATATSSSDYWFLTSLTAGIGTAGGAAARVQARIEYRSVEQGGAWRPIGGNLVVDVDQGQAEQNFVPFAIIPKNSDIRVVAKADASTAAVYAEVRGYLAIVV